MKGKKEIYYAALTNAAEMIRGHVESGMTEEELGYDLEEYEKQCAKVAKMLDKKAATLLAKYKTQSNP